MVLESKLLKALTKIIKNSTSEKIEITIKSTRIALEKSNFEFEDEEWKEIKGEVKEEITRILDAAASSSPVKQVEVKKTKYDKAAEKNIDIFKAMIGGDSGGEDEEEEEEVEVEEEEKESVGEEEEVEEEEEESKEPSKKKAKTSKSSDYKSKETISDSDDEGASESKPKKKVEKVEKKKEKEKADSSKEKEKVRRTSSTKSTTKKEVKPRTRTIVRKEGDAEPGTEAEESRIKQLKSLLTAAVGPRPFNGTTGAERTLTISERFEIFNTLLTELGLPISSNTSKLPSMDKAKVIGERRALEKEMQELEGVPIVSGLRGGKKRAAINSDDDEDEEEEEPVKSGYVPAKAFAAFLGDQSSSDDE